MANGHGGARPGSGRKKGSVNKATQRRLDVAKQALAEGITPLEVILEAMRDAYKQGAAAAVPYAKEAAPYVHPRLQAVDSTVKGEGAVAKALLELAGMSVPDKPEE